MGRRAKIVATLGPSTDGLEHALIAGGVDVVRLNFSHGEWEEHARRAQAVRQASAALGKSVAILQDLQGPKIRTGRLSGGGPVELIAGRELAITTEEVIGTAERVSCTYSHLPRDVRPGDRLLLDDGRIRLTVLESAGDRVLTRVEEGGRLGEHKGINLPGITVSAPALTTKDRADLRYGLEAIQVDLVALSFIRTAEEVREARALIRELGYTTPVVVKLEKPEAVKELEAILDEVDGAIMVARGDLGVELPPEEVPLLQKRIIQTANRRGLPVITATQMLESMAENELPTRAEASDVANAIWDGSDALMLSGESAAGRHPLRVVEMMDRIIRSAEAAGLGHAPSTEVRQADDPSLAVTRAACVLAQQLGAAAIIGVTGTGRTARLLARQRPAQPIHAFSADASVCRRLAVVWGVHPIHRESQPSLEVRIDEMESHLRERGDLRSGDIVVITGVHPYVHGSPTNFVKYEVIGGQEAFSLTGAL